ncbi:MAG: hypothetical protein AAB424_04335 [Patescibacteria group bacterium]
MAHSQSGCPHPVWQPTGKVWHFDQPLTKAQAALQDKEIFNCSRCHTSRALNLREPEWTVLSR